MDGQDESPGWATKDFTIPLLLSGLFSTVICIALCVIGYLSRDFINNDLAPRLGLIEPTPTPTSTPAPISCPGIPAGWKVVMNDNFNTNKYDWSIGKDTDAYADTDLQIVDDLLRLDIKANQGVFYYYYPSSKTLTDFYLTSQVQKVDGPIDSRYGLAFRINSDQLLFFTIQDSGRVSVYARDTEGDWQDKPLFQGYSNHLNVDKSNELTVFGRGSHYTFCINQYVAGEISNKEYQYGKSGIGISLKNANDEAVLEYDDFIIYAPAK